MAWRVSPSWCTWCHSYWLTECVIQSSSSTPPSLPGSCKRAGCLRTWALLFWAWEGIYEEGSWPFPLKAYMFLGPCTLGDQSPANLCSFIGYPDEDALHWQILRTAGGSRGDLQTSCRSWTWTYKALSLWEHLPFTFHCSMLFSRPQYSLWSQNAAPLL